MFSTLAFFMQNFKLRIRQEGNGGNLHAAAASQTKKSPVLCLNGNVPVTLKIAAIHACIP